MHYTQLRNLWLASNTPTKCPDFYPSLPKWVRTMEQWQGKLSSRYVTAIRSNSHEAHSNKPSSISLRVSNA